MQTAVQELKYLFDIILKDRGVFIDWDTYLAQEKQQIISAFFDGAYDADNISGEQYYNETYGSKGSGMSKKLTNHIVDTNEMISTQTDENGKPLTYWNGVDFTNPNANNIKSGSTIETNVEKVTEADYIKFLEKKISTLKSASSQTEISDEEIIKLANEHILYNDSKRQWVIEGMKLYREQLKQL